MNLTYPGNLMRELIGRVLGPDMFGARYLVTAAGYHVDTDTTAATLRPLKPAEFATIRADEWGQDWATPAEVINPAQAVNGGLDMQDIP